MKAKCSDVDSAVRGVYKGHLSGALGHAGTEAGPTYGTHLVYFHFTGIKYGVANVESSASNVIC